MLPLLSQRRFVLLHNGEADIWPRLGNPRHLPRQPLAASPTSVPRAADRPGARRPGAPHSAQERAAPHALGPDSAQAREPEAGDAEPPQAGSGDPSREPSPARAEEDGEARKPEDHRGS